MSKQYKNNEGYQKLKESLKQYADSKNEIKVAGQLLLRIGGIALVIFGVGLTFFLISNGEHSWGISVFILTMAIARHLNIGF